MARYALVIGIAEYESPLLPHLSKPTNDAEAIAQILEKHGGFQVKRLPSRWNQNHNCYEMVERKVTRNELGSTLKTFLQEQAVKNEALIYFTGHGFTVSDPFGQQQGYLATSDCLIEMETRQIVEQRLGIALDSLNKLIRNCDLSSLVVLLDCCYGGSFIERNLVEQTLTAFSSKKDYYLITACRSFEQAYGGEQHSVFTDAVLRGLSPDNTGSDGQISGDRLFDYISQRLTGSGQEPLRMGWGKVINLVTYPTDNPTLISTPPPDQPLSNNSINIISGGTITTFSGSGQTFYNEAPNQIRHININYPNPQLTPPANLNTNQRYQSLCKSLKESLELLEEYEQQERLTNDPKTRKMSQLEQEHIKVKIQIYQQEIKDLNSTL